MSHASEPKAPLRILLDVNHPSQAYMIRSIFDAMRARGHSLRIAARDKDVTLDLLKAFDLPFKSISRPRHGRLGAAVELVERELRFYSMVRAFKPHILLGTSVHAARASRLFGGRSVILNEDDASVVPLFSRVAYPLADRIVTPDCLKYENWGARHWTYPGTQKLFYLHPDRFKPDLDVARRLGLPPAFAIVRLSSLKAHHDVGRRGLNREAVTALATRLKGQLHVFVSAEGSVEAPTGATLLQAPPESMHHILAAATLVLSDSQSMTSEAGLIGTPAIRVNDFVGRITCLRELEKAGLAFGFLPDQTDAALDLAQRLAAPGEERSRFEQAHTAYFNSMPDPLPALVSMVESLPRR